MAVKGATGALATAAQRSADAAARSAKAKQGEKNEEAPRKQEEAKPAEQPAAEQAKEGAEEAQPPKADEPPRARPRAKAALSSAKEGAEKTERRDEGTPVVQKVEEHIEAEEAKGNDQTERRARVENAKHQGDLQIELALEDATDGKTEDRGYEEEDAARAREDRGLSPIEHADATQRAMIAEQLAEEAARFKDAQEEQLQGRIDEEKRNDKDQAAVDFSGMSAEERAVLAQNVASEQALLKREADVLAGGTSGEATDLEAIDVDEDGEGGDIEGLDNEDREARHAEIDSEIARLEDLDEQIAATFTDEELDSIAGSQLQVDSEDGSSVAWNIDDEMVDHLRSQRDRVAEERPELVPSAPVADQPVPAGAAGAEEPAVDPAADAGAPQSASAPAPLTDDQLLDGAASVGIIDPAARGQFAFNEAGELTYAAQPADGYWHAAEHVAPPAGQDFNTHWRNMWGENSMRNHGVPDEQFVATGQAIVIPGYHRDDFVRFFTPPTPAAEEGADAAPSEDQAGATAPAAESVPVSGTTEGDTTVLQVGGETVNVPESDFRGECLPDGTLVDRVDVPVGGEGGYVATVQRTMSIDDPASAQYAVIATATATPSVPEEAPAPDGDQPAGDEPAPQPTSDQESQPAATGPAPELVAQDVEQDGIVDVGGDEVYIYGADVVSDASGAANVYSDGVPVATVAPDGGVTLAEGSTDANVQALLSQQLLIEDADADGQYEFAYVSGDEAYVVEDPAHVERLNQLLAYYAETEEAAAAE
jgi:hypothetical protein